jgi:hypothetical protein
MPDSPSQVRVAEEEQVEALLPVAVMQATVPLVGFTAAAVVAAEDSTQEALVAQAMVQQGLTVSQGWFVTDGLEVLQSGRRGAD